MKPYHFLIVLAALPLVGCEHFRTAEIVKEAEEPRVVADAPMTPLPEEPKREPREYGEIPNFQPNISAASTDDVTIFSFDEPAPAAGYQMSMNTVPPGMMPANNNVMVQSYQQNPNYRPKQNMRGRVDEQIFFKFGSSRLGSIDQRKIAAFADQAKFAPINRVTVEGYASRPTQAGENSVKAHVLNLKESMNRSFAVSKSLMQKGLPAEKIKTVSYGSTRATGDGAFDRRVDMIMGDR
ncbi:MAG: OmpA family protein [Pseudomonadota bacterium]